MKNIPYATQWIDEDDIKAVSEALKEDFLTQGPRVDEFERKVAEYCGAKYAVAVNSGTSALHAACLVAGIGPGDEVITSPITFVASANCVLYCGGKPVFADIQKDSINIDPKEIEKMLTRKTKAIIPVHFAGHPCDLEEIRKIAKEHNLIVIEDAAHALGASYKRSKIGSCTYSDMTILSFHAIKHITTGEGGMVLTNNKQLYEKLRMLRTHGISKSPALLEDNHGHWYYEMQILGYNYRLTDIQAALGISQLKKLDSFVEKRRAIAETYNKVFVDNPYFDIPGESEDSRSSYHLYPIRLKDEYKDKKQHIFAKMREKGLGVQVHYIPVYLHPYYQKMGFRKGLCPLAEDFYQREISIPIFQSMTDEDRDYVVRNILAIFKEF